MSGQEARQARRAVREGGQARRIHRTRERGQAIIESIASIILFCLMLTMVCSITMYLYFEQAMVTAAREGARLASLTSNLSTAAGKSSVSTSVRTTVQALTGQQYDGSTDTITVVGPTGTTTGRRTCSVTVTYRRNNPLGIAHLIDALDGEGESWRYLTVSSSATMRYEE